MRRVDLALLGILAIAAMTRGFQLSQPNRLYFDEFYAQDACVYLGWAQAVCGQSIESTWMHPPLGKWFISVGIAVLGYEPIAWRLTAALAGVAMVFLVFVLTRRLTRSVLGAALAAGLIAVDPLSIVMSRIAMLDIFTACAGVATVLFVVLDADDAASRPNSRRGFFRPWRIAAGVAAGVAIATKWSGVLSLAMALVLVVAWEISGRNREREGRLLRLRRAAPSIALWLIVLPASIYLIAYTGRLGGELLAFPWQDGAWIHEFVERQMDMLAFHLGLDASHAYASPAWSWLLGKRPVVFLLETDNVSYVREIIAFADPLVWLPGLVAAMAACVAVVRRRMSWGPELVIGASVVGTYLPWLMLANGRSQLFVYYILPTVPFLAVALGWGAARLPRIAGRSLAGVLAAISLGVVLFWSPLIYGWPVDNGTWRARMPFTDCGQTEMQTELLFPSRGARQPPPGWCWI